ncbi:unnamed protein product, partial [Iphiclides podalirius]
MYAYNRQTIRKSDIELRLVPIPGAVGHVSRTNSINLQDPMVPNVSPHESITTSKVKLFTASRLWELHSELSTSLSDSARLARAIWPLQHNPMDGSSISIKLGSSSSIKYLDMTYQDIQVKTSSPCIRFAYTS